MNRSPARLRPALIALCLAVLAMRIAGIHLHLCFDGSEPPLSYHLADSGFHHADEHGDGESHSDRDLTVFDDVVAKKSSHDQDSTLPWLVLALLLFLLSPLREVRRAATDPPPLRSGFSRLRPPLRGPPSPA